jgi:putative ABC transport system permease protein
MIILFIISIPFLYILARKPILRRMAVRNAVRRPRESALVVLGTLLGTAIMTGSFVVGDTFDASIRHGAYEQLGPVDEVVSLPGDASAVIAAQRKLQSMQNRDIDGVLAVTLAPAAIATTGPNRVAAPRSQLLETDFPSARSFGRSPNATGISGPNPGLNEAAITTDLADNLHVRVGDEVEAFAYDNSVKLKVIRILPKTGIAGFQRDDAVSNNAFVPMGTIAGLRAGGKATAGAPPQSLVFVSNRGGVESGVELTGAVSAAIDAQLGAVPHSVDDVKQTVLDRAERTGKSLTRLYTSIGAFAVLAGILLLVNIFFMLADERKSEFGMFRAVGLKRRSLVGGFATEGWLYAVTAAIAGTFVGLLLGRGLIAAASFLFSSRSADDAVNLHFAFKWASVQKGMLIGFVIAVITVVATSIWLSRFNIIQAIRDITETTRKRPRRRASFMGMALAVVGLLVTGVGVGVPSFLALMLGPVLVLAGLNPVIARALHSRSAAATLSAVAVLVWAVACVPLVLALGGDIDIMLFVLQGLVLVLAAVVLVAQHQSAIGHALGTLAGGSLRVRLGLAYPLARRFRTSMTLGMFALVVFILVMVSVFAEMFAAQLGSFTREASGGFNTVIESNQSNPVPFAALAKEPGVKAVAPLVTSPIQVVEAPGLSEKRMWLASGFDQALIDRGVPKLDKRGSFASDHATYQAVLNNPDLAIVDKFFLTGGAGPPRKSVDVGDQFTVSDPVSGNRKTFTVAGVQPNDFAQNGIFIGAPAATALLGERAVANRAYIDVADPNAFTAQFAGRYLANGGKAETIRHVVQTELSQQEQFFMLMRTYLALGLIVGIAGIGVIMIRAVRERRRQVGVLRALGFQARAVRAAFVVESGFVAVEGVLIGTVLALVCSWSITLTDAFGSEIGFRVPWLAIAILVTGTLICALLATAAPARSAAKIDPAVALRIAD